MEDLFSVVSNYLKNSELAAAVEKIEEYLQNQNNIPINIAITGYSGSGKSSFVNAFRHIGEKDKGAAPTGVTETTIEVKEYPHPKYPNIKFWDLPGIGTTSFPRDQYLERVGFEKFDFFIIIACTRFREDDVKLSQEIQKMKKKFYFVRSKIDKDMRAERRKRSFSEEETLRKIREDCVQRLIKEGVESPQVFLVSSLELHLYDFSLLHETLERELAAHKRDALLLSMPNISEKVIRKKKEAFKAQIQHHALVSGFVSALPILGFSDPVDVNRMVVVVTEYVAGFGLDKPSLEVLVANTGVSYNDLCAVIKSDLAKEKITKELILKTLSRIAGTGPLKAVQICRWIPLLGTYPALGIAFTETYKALDYFLNMLAEDAQSVFIRALKK